MIAEQDNVSAIELIKCLIIDIFSQYVCIAGTFILGAHTEEFRMAKVIQGKSVSKPLFMVVNKGNGLALLFSNFHYKVLRNILVLLDRDQHFCTYTVTCHF